MRRERQDENLWEYTYLEGISKNTAPEVRGISQVDLGRPEIIMTIHHNFTIDDIMTRLYFFALIITK